MNPMSLALYAVVRPSRRLWVLTCGMCFAVLAVSGLIGAGLVGELAPVPRFIVGGAGVFIAFSVLYQQARRRTEFHIHISGSGQLRLAEVEPERGSRHRRRRIPVPPQRNATLLPASTIWSWLLLLRLQLDDKTVVTVPVLPDCLPTDTFRALSVACRWLAAHHQSMKY
ncbi:MAG: protein YgfX [Burkholderiaceae bacterium]